MEIRKFGTLSDGRQTALYILRNRNGSAAALTDYGASLVKLFVPDSKGSFRDVVLGYDDAAGYEAGKVFLGCTVGRFANRIGGAAFSIDGSGEYRLTANDGDNSLHGGCSFYGGRLWTARVPFGEVRSGDIYVTYARESLNDWHGSTSTALEGNSVIFSLDSPDGDQGFPGALHIEVKYTLTDDNELRIEYTAKADADNPAGMTPLNLTNHSYFNLDGHILPGSGNVDPGMPPEDAEHTEAGASVGLITDHMCMINADRFTPVDDASIPTGEIRSVTGTPLDFTSEKRIGQDIEADDVQLRYTGGYDHNYVLRPWPVYEGSQCAVREAAVLRSDESGIVMTVLTDLPGMQLYTGNYLDGERGKYSAVYTRRSGVCFETQFWPDAVNRENFPGSWLEAGGEFRSTTIYRFSVK